LFDGISMAAHMGCDAHLTSVWSCLSPQMGKCTARCTKSPVCVTVDCTTVSLDTPLYLRT